MNVLTLRDICLGNTFRNFLIYEKKKIGKLQIKPLKFGCVWILHPEVLEFRFYSLKFGNIWILNPNVLEFEFYSIIFGFYTPNFEILNCKIKISPKFME